jgi:hypothetical protein
LEKLQEKFLKIFIRLDQGTSNAIAAAFAILLWQFFAGILPNGFRPVPIVLAAANHVNVQLRSFISYGRDIQAIAGKKLLHCVACGVYLDHKLQLILPAEMIHLHDLRSHRNQKHPRQFRIVEQNSAKFQIAHAHFAFKLLQ